MYERAFLKLAQKYVNELKKYNILDLNSYLYLCEKGLNTCPDKLIGYFIKYVVPHSVALKNKDRTIIQKVEIEQKELIYYVLDNVDVDHWFYVNKLIELAKLIKCNTMII